MVEVNRSGEADTSIRNDECPVIPNGLSASQRQRVLGVCVVQDACIGPRKGFSDKLLCCKGSRDAIEMSLAAKDILVQKRLLATQVIEAARLIEREGRGEQIVAEQSLAEPMPQLNGYIRLTP